MLALAKEQVDVAILCRDLEASVQLYRDILGFELFADVYVDADLAVAGGFASAGFRQLRLRAGSTIIKLTKVDAQQYVDAASMEFRQGIRWLTFTVEDVDTVYDTLVSAGARVKCPPTPGPRARFATFIGPDGELLEFVQLNEVSEPLT